jgi:3-hydroxyacyl-[acyl-carrier-protein] dehydratase
MRWFWIDRFVEFESGRRAVAIKNVALDEEVVDDYVPGHPLLPSSLIVEGMAQTGGLLAGEHNRFETRVVLAKISRVHFYDYASPGDSLTYTATLEDIRPDGAFMKGTSHIGGVLQAEIELYFAHLNGHDKVGDLFEPADFLRMLRIFRLFEVGRNADGTPLTIPQKLLDAESADNALHAAAASRNGRQ